jgi:hypothetical protein
MHGGTILNGEWFGNETVESILSGSIGSQTFAFSFGHPMVDALKADFEVPRALRANVRLGPIFSIGGEKSNVFPHFHQENWLAQVHGEKLWVLATPSGGGLSDGYNKALRQAHTRLDACKFPVKLFRKPLEKHTFSWCVVKPTEALYLPRGWWHATCNLDDRNVAVGYIGVWSNKLHVAASNADGKGIMKAVKNGEDYYSLATGEDLTSLDAASMRGHADTVKRLLAKVKDRKYAHTAASVTLLRNGQ